MIFWPMLILKLTFLASFNLNVTARFQRLFSNIKWNTVRVTPIQILIQIIIVTGRVLGKHAYKLTVAIGHWILVFRHDDRARVEQKLIISILLFSMYFTCKNRIDMSMLEFFRSNFSELTVHKKEEYL